ncbi:MAG: glycerol-3-phosphate dehydrogenase/oxidase [Anaerolineaceae bacterium]|nr:glycerol-3-phosphate dehydrogenase/oxidase [Anaerolineaceae bacterium]
MKWDQAWREETWHRLDQEWDLVVIGGGITGAGILREAVHAGLKTLLLDANDFSFGTSSRSSKLIHGGFRYMANRQFDVTRESVREREWMLREAKSLVSPQSFIIPVYEGISDPAWKYQLGTAIYDFFGRKWKHRTYSAQMAQKTCPSLRVEGLKCGVQYEDAQVDDSRLVVRIIREAVIAGGTALNYARVVDFMRGPRGNVAGVIVEDQSGEIRQTKEVHASVCINASGPWSDEVRRHIGGEAKLRKLRGSHLFFPYAKFPLKHAITLIHPRDHRAMFAVPWEGVSLIGTTDLDHHPPADLPGREPFCTAAEVDYMMEAVDFLFPDLALKKEDILSSMAGLRPIISTGKENPGDESRAHAVWEEDGLFTISGGKITIFRLMARDVLNEARRYLPSVSAFPTRKRFFDPLPRIGSVRGLSTAQIRYLRGRYGEETRDIVANHSDDDWQSIGPLPNIWGELRWTAASEAVCHLDDLLLRRVRLGILLPNGAVDEMERIRHFSQAELGWDDTRWTSEVRRYQAIWNGSYAPIPADNEGQAAGEKEGNDE